MCRSARISAVCYVAVKEFSRVYRNASASDGRFSLEEVECMGACGGAPMIAINEDYFENVTMEAVNNMLDERQ